jgi:hypothetical protein
MRSVLNIEVWWRNCLLQAPCFWRSRRSGDKPWRDRISSNTRNIWSRLPVDHSEILHSIIRGVRPSLDISWRYLANDGCAIEIVIGGDVLQLLSDWSHAFELADSKWPSGIETRAFKELMLSCASPKESPQISLGLYRNTLKPSFFEPTRNLSVPARFVGLCPLMKARLECVYYLR